MDNQLLSLIHNYTEDREIDWTSAKVIGEQYGKVFKSEDDLREWKYLIDSYLKTFRVEDFQKVEEACKKKANKKKKKVVGEGVEPSDSEGSIDYDEMLEENGFWDKWERSNYDSVKGARVIWNYVDKGTALQDLVDGIQHRIYYLEKNIDLENDEDVVEEMETELEALQQLQDNIKPKNESRKRSGKRLSEGYDKRGKQDGTGPYRGSARSKKGPMAGDKKGMAQTLLDKGIAKSKKQADFLCKKYQDPKTGKVDVKKLENDIKKKERGQGPRKRKGQQSESKRNLDNFFKD
ncbi:MAG: hypothetical protein ACOCRX_08885 [Candidatus Woesearchaeota archaeon]